jgi:hypothetical protein
VSDPQGLRDLPGLLDWGDELYEATVRAEREAPGASSRVGGARAGRRHRWVPPRRAIPLLAAGLALVVPGAVVATRSIWDDQVARVGTGAPVASSPAIRLVAGASGDVRWRIGGWSAKGGRVCLRTEAFRGGRSVLTMQGCGVPQTRAGLTVVRSATDALTLVVGTTAAAVRSVTVTPSGAAPLRVAARAIPAETLRRSGITGAARVYVAVFPRGLGAATRPPRVTAYGVAGTPIATAAGGAAR